MTREKTLTVKRGIAVKCLLRHVAQLSRLAATSYVCLAPSQTPPSHTSKVSVSSLFSLQCLLSLPFSSHFCLCYRSAATEAPLHAPASLHRAPIHTHELRRASRVFRAGVVSHVRFGVHAIQFARGFVFCPGGCRACSSPLVEPKSHRPVSLRLRLTRPSCRSAWVL